MQVANLSNIPAYVAPTRADGTRVPWVANYADLSNLKDPLTYTLPSTIQSSFGPDQFQIAKRIIEDVKRFNDANDHRGTETDLFVVSRPNIEALKRRIAHQTEGRRIGRSIPMGARSLAGQLMARPQTGGKERTPADFIQVAASQVYTPINYLNNVPAGASVISTRSG